MLNINKKNISITSNQFYQEYQAKSGKEEVTSSSLELWIDTLKEKQKNMSALKAQIDSDKKQLFELKSEGTNIDKEVEIMSYLEKEKSHFEVLSDQWIKTLTFLVNDCGISNINADLDPKEIISLYYDCQK